jgi:dihydroflavonol-4-reductase
VTAPVLVTGGTGFVGGALVRRLLADGRAVRGLVRSDRGAASLSGLGAIPVRGDLSDDDSLRGAMVDVTTVFHAAGVNAMCLRDPGELFRTNVDGSASVIRAAAATGVARVVYTSSAATIGEPQGLIGREDTRHRGSFLSAYERSKFLAEEQVGRLAGELGVPTVTVNPSSVQGPGRVEGSARLLLALVDGRVPVVVPTFVSIVDIDDCTEGHVLAERFGVPGDRYVLNGATLSVSEAVALLRAVVGRPRHVLTVPRSFASIAGRLGDGISRLTGRRLPMCSELTRTLLHGHRYDGSRAARELGLRYRPIEETVGRTLAWYAEQGLLRRT